MINKKPFTSSPITLIEGEPRSGKTNTAVARVIDAYEKDPSTKIFANFRLYGVKYVLAPIATILEFINSKVLRDGYIIIDEAYIGLEAREGMSILTKLMTYLGMQAGKRRLYLIVIVQHGRMIDWRYRWLMNEHILCTYNEKTRIITLDITKKGARKKRTINYYAPQYWKYFDTEEIMEIPDASIAKALLTAR